MFPGDTCFGEEGGGTFSDSVWVIDPIDGHFLLHQLNLEGVLSSANNYLCNGPA